MGEIAMGDRIVNVETSFRQRERLLEAALVEALQPKHAEPDEARPALGLGFGERRVALSEFARTCASNVVTAPESEYRRELQRHIADFVRQLLSAREHA